MGDTSSYGNLGAAIQESKSEDMKMPVIASTPLKEKVIKVRPGRTQSMGVDPMLLTNKWNEKYSDGLADKGPAGIKQMNRGVSHLVAPINLTGNPKIQKICANRQKFLHSRNEALILANDPDYLEE